MVWSNIVYMGLTVLISMFHLFGYGCKYVLEMKNHNVHILTKSEVHTNDIYKYGLDMNITWIGGKRNMDVHLTIISSWILEKGSR